MSALVLRLAVALAALVGAVLPLASLAGELSRAECSNLPKLVAFWEWLLEEAAA